MSELIQATDEVVFMLKDADAGALSVNSTIWHTNSDVQNVRYDIVLSDGRTGAKRYIYAYRWGGTPTDLSTTKYVRYDQDSSSDGCEPGATSCGTAQSQGSSFYSLPTFKVHFKENWVTDDLIVKDPNPSSPLDDLLTRIQYSVPNETEHEWSLAGNDARFLGVNVGAAPSFNGDKPVRIIRGVQGTNSGKHTTKYEFIYPTQVETQVNLRVHSLMYLTMDVNHEVGIVNDINQYGSDAFVWNETDMNTDGTALDQIDGACPPGQSCPFTIALSYEDWTEHAGERRGTYVHLKRETRPIPVMEGRGYQYHDLLLQGVIGRWGRKWNGLGYMQDGDVNGDGTIGPAENDGGCGPVNTPESGNLRFARLENVFFSQSSLPNATVVEDIKGQEFKNNDLLPVLPSVYKQTKNLIKLPSPDPCTPTVSATNTGTGSVSIAVGACPPTLDPIFYRLYRKVGNGPLGFLTDLRTATTFTDTSTWHNKTYHYYARAYNEVNVESGNSAESAVTVNDSTPPFPPVGVIGLPGDRQATVQWSANQERDIYGYNVYRSSTSGGPYIKQNATALPAWQPQQWTQGNLNNGQSYYYVLRAVDGPGNESGNSAEVVVVPAAP